MDATILFRSAIAGPDRRLARHGPTTDVGRTPRWALAAALVTAILAAAAGGIVDGAGTARPAGCAPRPIPGGAFAADASDCHEYPVPPVDAGLIIPR